MSIGNRHEGKRERTSGVVGVLHRAGSGWRVLVAALGLGTRPRARPAVLEAFEVAADGAEAGRRVHAALERHGAGRLVCVLPASSVVCRTCTLPKAGEAELDEALRLQAEAAFLDRIPSHRLAMAVLADAPGETSRCGVILTWPEAAPGVNPPDRPGEGGSSEGSENGDLAHHAVDGHDHDQHDQHDQLVTWAPDVVGLIALMNGYRPADPLVWIDRHSGAVSLGVTHASGAVFRSLREELDDGDGAAGLDRMDRWTGRVARALGETALGVGHSESFVAAQMEACERAAAELGEFDAVVTLPPEIIEAAARRLEGVPQADAEWWRTYGIAAGVLLAAASELAPLTALQRAPLMTAPTRIRRIAEALSRPRVALATAAICLAIIGLAPLVAAGLRLGILKLRYPDIDEQVRFVEGTGARLAMYEALDENAWSMTKLLSDVVSNTPEGIELVSIRLLHSDHSFSVSGHALKHKDRSAPEVVRRMQENLRESGIFSEIKLNWDGANSYGEYDFELSAKVTRPHRRPEYDIDRDFANWPLADRQQGKSPPEESSATASRGDDEHGEVQPSDETEGGATDTGEIKIVEGESEDANPADEPHGGARANGSASTRPPRELLGDRVDEKTRRSDTDVRADGSGPGNSAIPEPLTDEQIDSMSLPDLRAALIDISAARKKVKNNRDEESAALNDRLQREFKQITQRLIDLQRKGGGS